MVSPSLTLLRTQSDERLIALARAGHERAFEAIVERYRRALLAHARRLLGDARGEEAVQQAFLAAWAGLQRGDDVQHLSGWLHRIVQNAALNALRGERDDYGELREWLAGAAAPEDEIERRARLRDTLTHLAALPARQREALLRIAVDGQSAEEVGSSLGLTEGAVRQLLYRARTALRAAATALTPMPVAGWLARAGPLTDRMAELAAGAGTAGLGSILAKTGVVVVVAGSAAGGTVVLDDDRRREPRRPATTRAVEPDRTLPAPPAGASVSVPAAGSDHSGPGSSNSGGGSDSSRSGSSGSSGSGSSGTSGSGSSGTSRSDSGGSSGSGSSGSGGTGTSGPGTSGPGTSGSGTSATSGTSGSGSSGSGDSSGSGSGGPDSDDDN